MNRFTSNSYIRLLFSSAVFLGCSGCGQVTDTLNKFDAAINEVKSLRESLERESTRWREQLQKSQLQLTNDVKTILNVDLRDNIDKSISEIGIELRCDVDFANNHLVAYLKGVEEALRNKRQQIKKEGLWKGFTTPEAAIADVIKNVGHLEPFVCHTIPTRLGLFYKNGQHALTRADRPTVEFIGYALKRKEDDPKQLSLVVFGKTRGPSGKPLPNASDLIATTHSYKVALESSRLLSSLAPDDTKIALRCGNETLSELLLGSTAEKETPVAKITDIILWVGTMWDDKDREIYFDYTIHRRSDGSRIGGIQKGRGEVWPDPSNRKPDWRSFTIPIDQDKRFTEAERFGYFFRVQYNSTNGDPNWNGRFKAEAVVEGGRTIPLLADTDDADYPKRYGRRDFDFNR